MNRKTTISDLEKHFVKRMDQGMSIDNIFSEFASMINATFTRFKYRNPDSYGVFVDKKMWINLFYSPQRGVFGFQSLNRDGTLQSALSLQHSDASVLDVILRIATNLGRFSMENKEDSYDSDSRDSESYDDDDDDDDDSY